MLTSSVVTTAFDAAANGAINGLVGILLVLSTLRSCVQLIHANAYLVLVLGSAFGSGKRNYEYEWVYNTSDYTLLILTDAISGR